MSSSLSADFLISPEGNIHDVYCGTYGYDQWEFDEVLQRQKLARQAA